MEFEVSHQNDIALISVSGEIDLFYAPKLRDSILDQLKKDYSVAVELSKVGYIDSSGIASLVEGYQFSKAKGSRFALIATSSAVMQVLQLARLDKVIPLYNNLDSFVL
jgi:anti-sigma B factor antagonist